MIKKPHRESPDTEILELLSKPPAHPEDDQVTEDSVLDGEMLAEMGRKLSEAPPPIVISRPSRLGPGIAALTVVAVALAGGIGIYAWSEVRTMSDDVAVHESVSAALIDEIGDQEEALVALRAAHQEEIERLQDAIAELALEGDVKRNLTEMQDLETRLEEVRADAMETELAAVGLAERQDDVRDSSERRRRRGGSLDRRESPTTTGSASTISAASLDDNPYDGVSSATNLNSRLWSSSGKGLAGTGSKTDRVMDGVISSAYDEPQKETRSGGDTGANNLPSTGGALPERPAKDAVRSAMNGVASSAPTPPPGGSSSSSRSPGRPAGSPR